MATKKLKLKPRPNRISKEAMYLKIAEAVAHRSTCDRLQVGTVITDENMWSVISVGYNGNYAGGPNVCDSHEPGHCGCIHSELNALIKPGVGKHTAFITHSPCVSCAKAIINAGIRRVYFKAKYRDISGAKLLKKAGLEVIRLA